MSYCFGRRLPLLGLKSTVNFLFMAVKLQLTGFYRNFGQLLERLERWALNPWRRYSLFLIILLTGFLVGSSIGMINGVLSLMDPVGAFFTVLFLEFMVRIRKYLPSPATSIGLKIIDIARIGLLYGLLLEAFKLA